ncbi:MAG: flagellar biosynthesis protein FliQ [Oscillospiraceae bacterium]
MDLAQALGAVSQGIIIAAKVSAPILLISMAVGLVISIFQAATQIHEQTLTFVPKFAVILAVILISGNWMMTTMVEFFKSMFDLML